MTITIEPGSSTIRERLHWSLDLGARSYAIDLLPAVAKGSVSIALDGRAMARLPKPTPQHPWREAAIAIEGETYVVGLTWHAPVMHTDLFASGRSLLDGRTIQEVRQTAPPPMSNYDVWVGGMMRLYRVPPGSLLPPWMALVSLVSIVILALIFTWQPRLSGRIVGLIAAAAMLSLFLIWFRSWVVVMDRAHTYLLRRPQLGDRRRLAGFFGAFLAYPAAAIALIVLLVLLA